MLLSTVKVGQSPGEILYSVKEASVKLASDTSSSYTSLSIGPPNPDGEYCYVTRDKLGPLALLLPNKSKAM